MKQKWLVCMLSVSLIAFGLSSVACFDGSEGLDSQSFSQYSSQVSTSVESQSGSSVADESSSVAEESRESDSSEANSSREEQSDDANGGKWTGEVPI